MNATCKSKLAKLCFQIEERIVYACPDANYTELTVLQEVLVYDKYGNLLSHEDERYESNFSEFVGNQRPGPDGNNYFSSYLATEQGEPIAFADYPDRWSTDPGACDLADSVTVETRTVYNCATGETFNEHIVSVDGQPQAHDATDYTTTDFPNFAGDGSGNVRSYYSDSNLTPIADADRPDPTELTELPCSELEIREEVVCKYTCPDGIEIQEVRVYVDGVFVPHDSTVYSAADFPAWVTLGGGDGSGSVRSYYKLTDGTNVLNADRPASVGCDPLCGEQYPEVEFVCIEEPDGSTGTGYTVCTQEPDPTATGASDPAPFIQQFDSVSTADGRITNVNNTINGDTGTTGAARAQLAANAGDLGSKLTTTVEYSFATPQDNVEGIYFWNNGGSQYNEHFFPGWEDPNDFESTDVEVLDSGGAVIFTLTGFVFKRLTSVTDPPNLIPFGLLNDVATVRLNLTSVEIREGGPTYSNTLVSQIWWRNAEAQINPPAEPATEAVTVCELFNSDGTPNTTGTVSDQCDFDYERGVERCVRLIADNTVLARVIPVYVFDGTEGDDQAPNVFYINTEATAAPFTFAFDPALHYLGGCDDVEPRMIAGCMHDSQDCTNSIPVYQMVPFVNGDYMLSAAFYKRQYLTPGQPESAYIVIPTADQMFAVGECGECCEAC